MKKTTFFILALISSSFMFSQEEEVPKNKFSFTGSVDTYFKRNISAPSKALTDANGDPYFVTPATAFANRNGFGLGMANIVVGYEGEKVGFVAENKSTHKSLIATLRENYNSITTCTRFFPF